jgi:hypothetical protein
MIKLYFSREERENKKRKESHTGDKPPYHCRHTSYQQEKDVVSLSKT